MGKLYRETSKDFGGTQRLLGINRTIDMVVYGSSPLFLRSQGKSFKYN